MKSAVQVSIQALNMLFSNLAGQNSVVFWMRNADFNQQLYVSPTFQDIWGVNSSLLYEHPESWYDTLVKDDRDKAIARDNAIVHTIKEPDSNNGTSTVLYRIYRPDLSIRWVKDDSFSLFDNEGNCIGIAGLSMSIPEAQWETEVRNHLENKKRIQEVKNYDADIFSNVICRALQVTTQSQPTSSSIITTSSELQVPEDKYMVNVNGQSLLLSKREAQCLYHLLEGRTAKQTGAILHLSQRTVETYLDNIKKKAKCRTKLELLKSVEIRHFFKEK